MAIGGNESSTEASVRRAGYFARRRAHRKDNSIRKRRHDSRGLPCAIECGQDGCGPGLETPAAILHRREFISSRCAGGPSDSILLAGVAAVGGFKRFRAKEEGRKGRLSLRRFLVERKNHRRP